MPRLHLLERTQDLPRPRAEVFAFFADAGNLEAITPPFLHFKILTPLPIAMQAGALIEYRLRLYGVPIRWRTRIESWEPEQRFVDVQLQGPYARWHHTHEFEDLPNGTRMRDRVEYAVPWGPLGSLAHLLFVKRSLQRIFDFRRDRVAERFGVHDASGLT